MFEKIDQELETKFQGEATPRLKPSREDTLRPQDIVAYASLFKNLEFAVPFEKVAEPIRAMCLKYPNSTSTSRGNIASCRGSVWS